MSRHVEDADEMFAAICEHLEFSNNGGNIRPAITVFRQRTPGKVTCDVSVTCYVEHIMFMT